MIERVRELWTARGISYGHPDYRREAVLVICPLVDEFLWFLLRHFPSRPFESEEMEALFHGTPTHDISAKGLREHPAFAVPLLLMHVIVGHWRVPVDTQKVPAFSILCTRYKGFP